MKPGTHIIYRPNNQGEQQHGKVMDTILQAGNTKYLVLVSGQFLNTVSPEDIEIIEEDHQGN